MYLLHSRYIYGNMNPCAIPFDHDGRGDDDRDEIEIDDYYDDDDDDDRRRPGKRRRMRVNDAGATVVVGPAQPPPPPITLDDVSKMDATAYLAHVDRQARSLPDVFVAPVRVRPPPPAAEAVTAAAAPTTTTTTKDGDGHVHEHGSLSTMRVFLSGKFDILPPPSTRHLPPAVVASEGGGGLNIFKLHAVINE